MMKHGMKPGCMLKVMSDYPIWAKPDIDILDWGGTVIGRTEENQLYVFLLKLDEQIKILGPDGRAGWVRTRCVLEHWDHQDDDEDR